LRPCENAPGYEIRINKFQYRQLPVAGSQLRIFLVNHIENEQRNPSPTSHGTR
jgi:hypothetical protein